MTRRLSKKVLALILACLLIVGAIPAFATTDNTSTPIAVVEVGYTGTNGDVGDDGYPYYSTIGAAIDSFNGKTGKVWVLNQTVTTVTEDTVDEETGETIPGGTVVTVNPLVADGTAIEGTTADREKVIIAGYDDNAEKGTLQFGRVEGGWLKGDISFANITLSQPKWDNNWYGLYSNGYTITFDKGVVASGNLAFAAESKTNTQNIVINDGTVAAIYSHSSRVDYLSKTPSFNSNI